MTFRSKLTLIMAEKGLTIQKLSDDLKVSRISISHWRSGKRIPSTPNLVKMSQLWEIPVDYLLSDDRDVNTFLSGADSKNTAQRTVAV
tara:strand:- start:1744 stop:2007 length:264 start_codon:yes stop_codon:yes gene_type:complete